VVSSFLKHLFPPTTPTNGASPYPYYFIGLESRSDDISINGVFNGA